MYPGHFAAGLALKAYEPKASTLGIMIGVGWVDLLYGVFHGFHLEGGTLAHIDCTWSHSLVMAPLWCAAYAAMFFRAGGRVARVMFAAAFSHVILDLVSHHPDIDLWPHSRVELGFGPLFGGLGGWLEIAVCLAACALYSRSARKNPSHGRHGSAVCVLVALMWVAEVAVVHGAI